MRREALKAYIFALISEGAFEGMSALPAIATKAVAIFAQDLPAVLGEFADQGGNRIGAAVMGKVSELIGEVSRRGFKSVWSDLQEQYKRGAAVNAETAARRKGQ